MCYLGVFWELLQFSKLHKNSILSYFSVFCLSQLFMTRLKCIFVLLNDCNRSIKIYQNPHWKNNFSQLMTQLFMFDQTRASKPRVCAVIIRGAISHQGENFPIVSCWMFFVFLGYCQGFSHYFLVIFFWIFTRIFLFFLLNMFCFSWILQRISPLLFIQLLLMWHSVYFEKARFSQKIF